MPFYISHSTYSVLCHPCSVFLPSDIELRSYVSWVLTHFLLLYAFNWFYLFLSASILFCTSQLGFLSLFNLLSSLIEFRIWKDASICFQMLIPASICINVLLMFFLCLHLFLYSPLFSVPSLYYRVSDIELESCFYMLPFVYSCFYLLLYASTFFSMALLTYLFTSVQFYFPVL